MDKYQFVFFSGAICFTSPYIREVSKEIAKRVEKEKVESVKHDIELQMIGEWNGVPLVLYSCYLYNDSFELIHGSICNTKTYLKTAWEYHTKRNHRNNTPEKVSLNHINQIKTKRS